MLENLSTGEHVVLESLGRGTMLPCWDLTARALALDKTSNCPPRLYTELQASRHEKTNEDGDGEKSDDAG